MNFKEKRILGMIHLSGDDSNRLERALAEIAIYDSEGLYGCIIENYHGSVIDVEEVLEITTNLRSNFKIGINILPNEFEIAFKLADKYKADFIQLDYVAGNYLNTNKFDYAKFIEAQLDCYKEIFVLGGVWPKYYTPVKGSILANDIYSALDSCDGLVVTGSGTGKETPIDKIKEFREHMITGHRIGAPLPLIVGAGVDASNVLEQLEYADGAIVGSCFKPYKRTQEMVSRELVKEFMDEVKKLK